MIGTVSFHPERDCAGDHPVFLLLGNDGWRPFGHIGNDGATEIIDRKQPAEGAEAIPGAQSESEGIFSKIGVFPLPVIEVDPTADRRSKR